MAEGGRTKGVDEKFCETCGAAIKIIAEICPKCGVRQKKAEAKYAKKRTTAILLALVLGGIGAHKFYVGRTFAGAMHLLFCWTLIPGFVGFVEGLTYLMNTSDDEEFNRKYVPLISQDDSWRQGGTGLQK